MKVLGIARRACKGLVLCAALVLAACGGAGGPGSQAESMDAQALRALAAPELVLGADDGLYAAGALAADGDASGAKVDVFPPGPVQGALAVWSQREGARDAIWSNRYVPGVGWGRAQRVPTSGEGDAIRPEVVTSRAGVGLAVWRQFDGTRQSLWANRYDMRSGQWGTPQQIESSAGGDSLQHQVAMNRDTGAAVVVWAKHIDPISTQQDIWATRFDTQTGWAQAERIETNPEPNTASPQVVVANEGGLRAVAVWKQGLHVWSNEFNGGQWGAAQPVETTAAFSGARLPHLAANNSLSEVVAVWERHDGTHNNIWASRYHLGAWKPAQLLESGSGNAFAPQIAIQPAGDRGMVVWAQFDGERSSIWARSYEGDGIFGAAELVESRNAGNALNPKLAVAESATPALMPMVVWEEEWALGDFRKYVWANEKLSSGGWRAPQLIVKHPQSPRSDNFAFEPDVAMDASGSAMAVWSEQEGTHTNIRANRSEPNATLGGQWGVPQLIEAFNGVVSGIVAALR
jgi:hypothetical protein